MNNLVIVIGIQVFLLAVFVGLISYICRLVQEKKETKSTKKTCILIWFLSAIAWFIMAQIVWIISASQFKLG